MRVLANISSRDKKYQGTLAAMLKPYGAQGKLCVGTKSYTQLFAAAEQANADVIVVSSPETLGELVAGKANISEWRGSVLQTDIPILIISPLHLVHMTKAGRWLMEKDLEKLLHLAKGKDHYAHDYQYKIIDSQQCYPDSQALAECAAADCLVADIETTRTNDIDVISFTIIKDSEVGMTWVFQTLGHHNTIAKILALDVPKAFHNGAFDCFQLLRFDIPVNYYILDTEYMWKCWHAELDKSLAFISSVLLRDYYYWKEEVSDDRLQYCAKDTINTARCLLIMMKDMPRWAWINYSIMFPLVFPAIGYGFEGIKADQKKLEPIRVEAQAEVDALRHKLQVMAAWPTFNPGSPQQVAKLLYTVIGAKKPKRCKSKAATGEVELKKIRLQHPFIAVFVELILEFRDKAKALSTYYNASMFNGRIMYSVKIDGTETGRLASSKSPLYVPLSETPGKTLSTQKNYGAQVQNFPPYYKKLLLPDDGYTFFEIDKSQSEARCVARQSGDKELIQALEGGEDFYCYTAWKFFGNKIDKSSPVRQITKKIIHGTNYKMGAETFIDSVGIEGMSAAMRLLEWEGSDMVEFANHLLGLYHKAYPGVQRGWKAIRTEVSLTGKLVTEDGWTREIFGDIVSDDAVWRACIAHKPQHLSVAGLNKSLIQIYFKLQLGSEGKLRVKAQVHDSIIGQTVDPDYYIPKVHELLDTIQKTKHGDLRIPLDIEVSTTSWKEKKEWQLPHQ